ncbi:Cytosolic carboxypeptidase 6 [Symbiodinium microadriaticum]|uniref:Cytosolic carboxypeptidase 6 n=1 Tax=Symbiodinium microadriaticum TaxID=2951 RepID=A0A1Q9DPQ7_SYMMI|nr:Cytosolic carboxypeptidase 6 [Symbiodinium microadriaticum]
MLALWARDSSGFTLRASQLVTPLEAISLSDSSKHPSAYGRHRCVAWASSERPQMVRWRDLLRSATENGINVQGCEQQPAVGTAQNSTDGTESLPEEVEDEDLPPLVSHELEECAGPEADEPQYPEPRTDEEPTEKIEDMPEQEEEPDLVLDDEDVEEELFEESLPSPAVAHPKPEGIADGPWHAGGFEFFAAFDSGNLCGAALARPCESQDHLAKKDLRAADVLWAAAEPQRGKLLYKMTQSCAVRREPHPKAKLVTKKSAGARLYASRRVTLSGWQKLADEDGWAQLGPATAEAEGAEAELLRFASQDVQKSCDAQGSGDETMSPTSPLQQASEPSAGTADGGGRGGGGGYPSAPMPSAASSLCFEVTARADCAGTPFASEECQWFHFGLRGRELGPGERLSFRVLGLSRYRRMETTRMVSGQLLTDGLQPVFRSSADAGWQLVRGEIGMLRLPDGMLAFTFEHTMSKPLAADEELYFALTFPYPLGRIYSHLNSALKSLVHGGAYVNREQLTTSLGGHPIELVTVTRRSQRSAKRQPLLPDLTQEEAQRPWIFPERRAIFVSARVHPGETPASFMLEGLLDFLASGSSEAMELLRQYVVHVVPVLNPDGVAFGHHRLDMRAENLNRVYGKASLEHHPSIVAAEKACLCAHEHQGGLRLYLDLHAHSNRRGAFLLADAGRDAEARLFGWALGRCCNIFEYSQSDFSESKRGTGKSTIAKLTGNPLCYTVECHYIRGHHSAEPFGPQAWYRLGWSLCRALLALDFARRPRRSLCPPGADPMVRYREITMAARRLLLGEKAARGAMERWQGLLCALCAAVAFGVQYAPVKKYEIYDGITFQWFMCAGILMVGFVSSTIFGDFGMKDNECLLIIAGGALWALSNYLVLPLVKLLGIGLGFSLYHFVNLMVGYVVGRLGLFGMAPLEGSLHVCDAGCALILASFIIMVFVEGEQGNESQPSTPIELPRPLFQIDPNYREMYHRWRQGESRGSKDAPVLNALRSTMFGYSAVESGGNLKAVGGFALGPAPPKPRAEGTAHAAAFLERHEAPMPRNSSEPTMAASSSSDDTVLTEAMQRGAITTSSPRAVKLLGVSLALFAGGLAGVQSVPAAIYNQRHPGASPTVVVFPQCLGIYICSSFIYLFYAAVARASGWSIPHSAIRPPYFSGCIWAIGFSFMIVGISALGFSIGYTLDAVGPIVVASMLSIFVFKEITRPRQLILYWCSFGLQLMGVILMTAYGKHSS